MIKITVDNSYSNISGLTVAEHKELSQVLSYQIGGSSAYFSGGYIRRRSLLGKRGDFPTGLLKRITQHFRTNRIQFKTIYNRLQPNPTVSAKFCGPTPYEDQLLAVEAAEHYKQGTISMPTGTGKSLVIALIAARLGVKTLVVVPTLEIKKQMIEGIKKTFLDSSFIDVHNIDSKALNSPKDYGCLIIDEGHHSAAKTYQKLNKTAWKGIYYRFFLTATPFRNDDEEKLLFESIAGQVIYRLSYQKALAKGYIVPVEAYYIEIPKQKTNAYTWAEVYKELVVNNEVRNVMISDLLANLYASHKSSLCLVKEVAHGNNLARLTGAAFTCGEDDESKIFIEHFNNKKLRTLIATTGVCGEGLDTKPCEYVIIAGLGKAKSQFMQQVGRSVRTYAGKESAKIIIIKDKSHKFLLRHFNIQCKILAEEYGVIPVRLDV